MELLQIAALLKRLAHLCLEDPDDCTEYLSSPLVDRHSA